MNENYFINIFEFLDFLLSSLPWLSIIDSLNKTEVL